MANKIIAVLLVLATVCFLIINPIITTAFSRGFYEPFYSEDFKTTAADQKFLTESVLDYVQGIDVAMVPFSPADIAHLNDVRNIFKILEIINITAVIFLVLLIPFIWYYKKNKQLALKPVMIGSSLALGVILVLTFCLWLNFENFFIKFHQIFFPQGNWQFAAGDLLILLFPGGLFQILLGRILSFSIILSSLFLLLSYLLLYKLKNNH